MNNVQRNREGEMSALQVIEVADERPALALEPPIGTTFATVRMERDPRSEHISMRVKW